MKLSRSFHTLVPYSYCKGLDDGLCPDDYMDSGAGAEQTAAAHAAASPGHRVRVVSTSVQIIETAGTLVVTDA